MDLPHVRLPSRAGLSFPREAPGYHPYLPYGSIRPSFFSGCGVLSGTLEPNLLSISDKPLQSASLNQGFNLLFQVEAVVAVVLVDIAVLVMALFFQWGMDSLGPFDTRIVPYVHKYLFYRCIKRGIILKLTRGKIDSWPCLVNAATFSGPRAPLPQGACCGSLFLLLWCELDSTSHSCLALRMSSAFICYYVFTMRLIIWVRGFFDKEKRSLEGAKPAIRAGTIILSSTSSTCKFSLLN